MNNKPIIIRFFDKVNKTASCWFWIGGVNSAGYGVFSNTYAHRWIYEYTYKQIPRVVLHKCDNPLCVNPDHLEDGTQLMNRLDCKYKGRTAKGESNGSSKLTEKEVLEIRESKEYQRKIANKYGISQALVSEIKLRKIWKHI